jgi:hypothetical protein
MDRTEGAAFEYLKWASTNQIKISLATKMRRNTMISSLIVIPFPIIHELVDPFFLSIIPCYRKVCQATAYFFRI